MHRLFVFCITALIAASVAMEGWFLTASDVVKGWSGAVARMWNLAFKPDPMRAIVGQGYPPEPSPAAALGRILTYMLRLFARDQSPLGLERGYRALA